MAIERRKVKRVLRQCLSVMGNCGVGDGRIFVSSKWGSNDGEDRKKNTKAAKKWGKYDALLHVYQAS